MRRRGRSSRRWCRRRAAHLRAARRADGSRRACAAARRRARRATRSRCAASRRRCRRRCSWAGCAPARGGAAGALGHAGRLSPRCCAMRDARLLFVDAAAAALVPAEATARCIALDAGAPGTAFDDWLAPPGTTPQPVDCQAGLAVQHHLLVGHDRHAEGHRAAARACAGRTRCAARPTATARIR